VLSWPSFTTAAGQVIAADSTTMTIPADGFVSVNLAPNQGATPAGGYYTAVIYMSDGTVSTQYWVVPAAAQASLAQVQAQVMPAAQAVQAVSKAYVDQSIAEINESQLAANGGTLTGPLYLNGDPTQAMQAADKHYVDAQVATALPLAGGTLSGPVTAPQIGAAYQVDQFAGADFGAKLQACLSGISAAYGGTCDARNFAGNLSMASNLAMSTGNTVVLLPCATIATANQLLVTAGTRNVSLRGCAMRGGSAASGGTGGTVFAYSGSSAMVIVGDPTYAVDTPGFHMDNLVINTTSATSAAAQALKAYRTQELDLEDLYFLGNQNQTGMTLDGTGNYTGGTFRGNQFSGFQIAVNAIGHQATNSATTDWVNASSFVRIHIDCPTTSGAPISGTYGINLLQGDGNTFTGGDVEGCATALHSGANAQNNTIVGLRNENSTNQVVADAGSSYNSWMTGGTMFTGQLIDNGTRNSFLDTFHRSFNSLNGDWFGSQQDATLTNHFRLGIGTGNERGLLNRYQTDSGYRWTTGLSDATAGEQFYQVLDELNNVYRLSIGQYNSGQASTNNQTVINAAGTGAVVLNGSNGAGTGGVIFGSGGASETSVATINNAGNALFNGTLQVGGTSQSTGTMTVRNNADAEVDYYLWPGLTTSQKGSFTYKDWNGNSQWYMVKDASNNWALNSATGGLDSLKAYQSTNSGDTYINASNSTGHIRMNYEGGSGAETDIYSGSSGSLDAAFSGPTSIKFPGLAATSGHFCMQVDSSGYLTNTGAACGTGTGGSNGTINSGNTGQIAYYTGSGTSIGGINAVPLLAGGTGATSAAAAVSNLLPGIASDSNNGMTVVGNVQAAGGNFSGPIGAATLEGSAPPLLDIRNSAFAGGAVCDGVTDIGPAMQAAVNALPSTGGEIQLVGSPVACYWANPNSITWGTHTGPITLLLQGELHVGTTLTFPSGVVHLIGKSGAGLAQFQGPGETAWIYEHPLTGTGTGTLGTAIAVPSMPTAGSSVTFTPSNMNGLYAGTAITVAGTLTCSVTSVTRNNNQVTAAFSSGCHIPPGTTVTVAGMTDTSFNGSYTGSAGGSGSSQNFLSIAGDQVKNTLTWVQYGANGTTSGGTVTGMNEDTAENVQISATTSTTATATFYRPHTAGDQWAIVGVNFNNNGQAVLMRDIQVTADGTAIWVNQVYLARFEKVGVTSTGACGGNFTSFPVDVGDSSYITFEGDALNGWCDPWAMRLEQPYNIGYADSGPVYVNNSTFGGSIKLDHGGYGVSVRNSIFEQAPRGAVAFDPSNYWNGNSQQIRIENSMLQDNPNGFQESWVTYLTPSAAGNVDLSFLGGAAAPYVNDYFQGALKTSNPGGSFDLNVSRGIVGTHNDGKTIEAEVRDEQATMQPALIPYTTVNVTTNPSGWTGGCTVATGVLAPDGTATAGSLTSSGYNTELVGTKSGLTPAVGDVFLFGGWVFSPTHGAIAQSGPGGDAFRLDNGYSSHWTISPTEYNGQAASSDSWDSSLTDDWWHPVVGFTQVASSDGTSGQWADLNLNCDPTKTMNYFDPWMIYIPASANIPLAEVMRWRQQLMHGSVPPNYTGATGHAATMAPIDAPSYNILNPATGAVAPFGTVNLADWTNSGVANGSVPVWNSTTGKWTPGSLPNSVSSINGNSGAFTLTGAGVSCTGTTCTVMGSTASGNVQTASQYSPAYYTQSGSNTTLGGVTPFTGLSYWQASAPPAAATAAQIVSAIGSTAVSNATTAANFSGALNGDVTGTQGATMVAKVNGGVVPASAGLVGTNASSQLTSIATLPASAEPAHTGDVTNTAGSLAMTVGKINGGAVPASAPLVGTNASSQLTSVATLPASAEPAHTGDVTNTAGSLAMTVGKINGGAVAASVNALATNSSSQPVAATSHNLSVPANCVTTGSANAYSCTTSPSFTPAAGDHIQVEFNVADTGASTLAVNGATAAAIRKWGNTANLAAGDVQANHWISATYDGTYWQLEGQLGNANATQVNGAAVPASAAVLSSNSSSQLTAATTTGSGNVVLATSPALTTPTLGVASATSLATSASSTLGGSANIFNNGAAASNLLEIQAGTSAAQAEEIQWQNYSGTAEWQNTVDTSYAYHIKDALNNLDRMTVYQGGGNTNVNAGSGAYAVCLNCAANSGTSGLLVQNGAATPATVLTVTGSGNTTAAGFVSGKFLLGSGTMTLAAGAAAGSSPTIACATSHVCDGVSGTVTLTTGTSPTTGTLATLTFPNTRTNYANCVVTTQSATAVITSDTWTESAAAITVTANSAPAASTAYTVRYWCGGN
jgi:hypothetical protein